jgi:hypothetical protein
MISRAPLDVYNVFDPHDVNLTDERIIGTGVQTPPVIHILTYVRALIVAIDSVDTRCHSRMYVTSVNVIGSSSMR